MDDEHSSGRRAGPPPTTFMRISLPSRPPPDPQTELLSAPSDNRSEAGSASSAAPRPTGRGSFGGYRVSEHTGLLRREGATNNRWLLLLALLCFLGLGLAAFLTGLYWLSTAGARLR